MVKYNSLFKLTLITFLITGPNLNDFDFGSITRVVHLPKNWRWDSVDHSCYTTIINGKDFVHKIVLLSSLMLTFFVNGREIFFPFLKNSVVLFALLCMIASLMP